MMSAELITQINAAISALVERMDEIDRDNLEQRKIAIDAMNLVHNQFVTLHDFYVGAALTGLIASATEGEEMKDLVFTAREFAAEAMKQR